MGGLCQDYIIDFNVLDLHNTTRSSGFAVTGGVGINSMLDIADLLYPTLYK